MPSSSLKLKKGILNAGKCEALVIIDIIGLAYDNSNAGAFCFNNESTVLLSKASPQRNCAANSASKENGTLFSSLPKLINIDTTASLSFILF